MTKTTWLSKREIGKEIQIKKGSNKKQTAVWYRLNPTMTIII